MAVHSRHVARQWKRLCQVSEAEYVKWRSCRAHWTGAGCRHSAGRVLIYRAAVPWLMSYIKVHSLNCILLDTGSQWSCFKRGGACVRGEAPHRSSFGSCVKVSIRSHSLPGRKSERKSWWESETQRTRKKREMSIISNGRVFASLTQRQVCRFWRKV